MPDLGRELQARRLEVALLQNLVRLEEGLIKPGPSLRRARLGWDRVGSPDLTLSRVLIPAEAGSRRTCFSDFGGVLA